MPVHACSHCSTNDGRGNSSTSKPKSCMIVTAPECLRTTSASRGKGGRSQGATIDDSISTLMLHQSQTQSLMIRSSILGLLSDTFKKRQASLLTQDVVFGTFKFSSKGAVPKHPKNFPVNDTGETCCPDLSLPHERRKRHKKCEESTEFSEVCCASIPTTLNIHKNPQSHIAHLKGPEGSSAASSAAHALPPDRQPQRCPAGSGDASACLCYIAVKGVRVQEKWLQRKRR